MLSEIIEREDRPRGGSHASPPDTDGRHLRRERNRGAVVAALLELFREGNLAPSSNEIAERAGLSPRSLFRYFDDVDDLCRAAINLQLVSVAPAAVMAIEPDRPLTDRVGVVVAQRIALFEAMGMVGVVARLRAPSQPLIADELTQARSYLRHQLERMFARELGQPGSERFVATLAAADVLCSFEGYRLMRDDQGLDRDAVARTFTRGLLALLTHRSDAEDA